MCALGSRLEAAARETDEKAVGWLQRAWQLGPKRVGPNLLLVRDPSSASLWDIPLQQVVHLSKQAVSAALN